MSSSSTPYTILTIACVVASIALVTVYNISFAFYVRKHPHKTVFGMTSAARRAWVASVMLKKQDILAVQSLRNWIMASSILASTSIVILFGFITFTSNVLAKADALNMNTTGEDLAPSIGPLFSVDNFFSLKVIVLLGMYMSSFFCFAQAMRFFNHVSLMINITLTTDQMEMLHLPSHFTASIEKPDLIAQIMNRGALYHTLGLRGYYYSFPVFAWIWGPWYLLLATVILVVVLRILDFHTAGMHVEEETDAPEDRPSPERVWWRFWKRREPIQQQARRPSRSSITQLQQGTSEIALVEVSTTQ